MTDFLTILVATVLVNNLVLVQLLGVSAVLAFSTHWQQARDLALFSLIVLTLAATISGLLSHHVLAPLGLMPLQLVLTVLVSGSIATLLALWVRNTLPLTYRRNQLGLLLAGGNSAVIGVALIQGQTLRSPAELLTHSLAAGLSFAILLLVFTAFRQRLALRDSPAPFRGPAAELFGLGILAMSLQAMGKLI